MSDELPGVNRPSRIVIDEADLAPAPPVTPQAPTSGPPAPVPAQAAPPAPVPARPPRPPAPPQVAPPAQIPKPAPLPPKAPALGSYCSGCGNPVHDQAIVCPRCGVPTRGAAQATTAAVTVALNSKSSAAAILLSLVFTGAGHWYVGRIGRGFAWFGAAVLSGILVIAVIGLVLLPLVWVGAAIDANNCARKHNAALMREAGMPSMPPTLNA
jgi:TM2 domain-containing membrane protein YozV